MKVRTWCAVVVCLAMLAVSVASAAASTRQPAVAHSGTVGGAAVGQTLAHTIYSQNDNDNGVGIVSQNFESAYANWDSQGADDFTVPAGQTWKIKRIAVTGVYFNGVGPAASETVTFYKNAHGSPGLVKSSQVVVGTDDGWGSFTIPLAVVALKGGVSGKHYWVSVQANMDFASGGEWAWETRTVQNGQPSVWQNPAGGLGTGCATWRATLTCAALGEGPDNMYALSGVVVLT